MQFFQKCPTCKNENEVLIISADLNVPKSQVFCFTDEEEVIYKLGSHQ